MISDTHNDFLTKLTNKESKKYLLNCKKSNVSNLLCSVFTSEYTKTQTIKKIKKSAKIIKNFGNSSYKLHIEDLGFIENQKNLNMILNTHPFSCSLTWNNDNQFAGGNFGTNTISKKGKELINILEQSSIIVDCAHLNRKSFYALSKSTTNPLFCSHTGLNFIVNSPRNLTNNQVNTIIDSGGYFGLFLSPTFMTKNGQMNSSVFATIIYKTLCRFNCPDSLGIGTDFYGIGIPPQDISSYADFQKVKEKLLNFGITKETINKIFYQNFQNYIAKTKKIPLRK